MTTSPFAELRCVVFGSFVSDCIVEVPTIPSWGSDVRAHSISMSPGGKAANQAVALAKFGATVSAVGVIGDDGIGADLIENLSAHGVNTAQIRVRTGAATPICLVLSGERNQKSIAWNIPDGLTVSSEQARESEHLIAAADMVFVTLELPPRSINTVVELADKHGTGVVLNAGPRRPVAETAEIRFDGITALVANEFEARVLPGLWDRPGTDAGAFAEFRRRHRIDLFCLTRGADGCSYWSSGQHSHQSGLPIIAQNAVGAGDAFVAALGLHMAAGFGTEASLERACAAGAIAAETPGTLHSMPGYEALIRRAEPADYSTRFAR